MRSGWGRSGLRVSPVKNVRTTILVALGVLALAGCTGQGYLPTVNGSSSGASLEDVAKAYASCLEQNGVNTTISADDTGAMTVVDLAFQAGDSFIWQTPYGNGSASYQPDELTQAVFDASEGSGGYRLVVNGRDYSDAYGSCHHESGYTELGKPGLDTTEPDELTKQAMMKASADWAECARSNGWPQVADPVWTPGQPGVPSMPIVLLPASTTEEQLRALIGVCPVSPVPVEGSDNPDAIVYPTIGFDYPGFDGRFTPGQKVDTTTPEYQRLSDLMAILYEDANPNLNGGQGG